MSYYNVIKLAEHKGRQFLVIRGIDDKPMVSVYCEHEGQTLLRPCEPTLANLRHALRTLEIGEDDSIYGD